MFEHLERLPEDPILGLSAASTADPNADKVDLTVGIYKDETGQTPVFEAVRLAQEAITAEEVTKAYIAQIGDPAFNSGLQRLLLGTENPALAEGRGERISGGTGISSKEILGMGKPSNDGSDRHFVGSRDRQGEGQDGEQNDRGSDRFHGVKPSSPASQRKGPSSLAMTAHSVREGTREKETYSGSVGVKS